MTTYILHGGETSLEVPTNTAFWSLMASRIPEGGTWLGCYFARFNEPSLEKFQRDSAKIQTSAPHPVTCLMATPEEFANQIKSADVIYFAGGSTLGLLSSLSDWPQMKTWLSQTKVVAGSSAGMNILGRRFVTKKGECGEGYGLVPYNLLVHHHASAYAEVHKANPLPPPVLALHETQFCVLEL